VVAPVSNATTMAAPFGALANAGTTWCGSLTAMPMSAHRVRLIDAIPTPQNGRDGAGNYVAAKLTGPPRGVPR
jgi:hypothetical protein